VPTVRKVRIISEPPGALIAIDGVVFGPAPLTAALTDGATASVRAELAGHVPTVQSVRIADGVDEIRLTLTATPTPPTSEDRPLGATRPKKPATHKPTRRQSPVDAGTSRPTFDPNRPLGPQ
jgi:hypothetical protein